MQHYTTIEQSKHLLELGLNPESADMAYLPHYDFTGCNFLGYFNIPIICDNIHDVMENHVGLLVLY